jgi:glyoxylase-like metal-dependent hydrolase (beta-lactamase superfamily II)
MSGFASTKDLADTHAEDAPNSGVVIGDESVLVVDAQATPLIAQGVLARIWQVTDKPVRHVVLSHRPAARVLGAQLSKVTRLFAIIRYYRTC